MAEPPNASDHSPQPGPEGASPPSAPRWVKVFGVVALVLVLLFVILHLTGRGFRGHAPSREDAVNQP